VQNVVTYDVVVNVDNTDHALKPGMTASVQIVTAEHSDVLRVADQALRYSPDTSERTQKRLWLLRDGKPVPAAVTIGLDDDTNSEIVQGAVQAGDLAIIGEQHETSARSALPAPHL
jgi:HlyD family secretion protein